MLDRKQFPETCRANALIGMPANATKIHQAKIPFAYTNPQKLYNFKTITLSQNSYQNCVQQKFLSQPIDLDKIFRKCASFWLNLVKTHNYLINNITFLSISPALEA